jgi:hypothetical protein
VPDIPRSLDNDREMSKSVTINLTISEEQALALARMCNRFCYEDAERFADRLDGGRERDAMFEGTIALERALSEAGFAPR